ncbi:hypothetical protein [Mycolicibacter minnesotensis]
MSAATQLEEIVTTDREMFPARQGAKAILQRHDILFERRPEFDYVGHGRLDLDACDNIAGLESFGAVLTQAAETLKAARKGDRAATAGRWAAVAACVFWTCGTAHAEPGQPPLPTTGEGQACEQAWSQSAPNDPRVSMRYGFGSAMFYSWVRAQCNGPDAKFPNGARVAGSGLEPELAPWQRLPVDGAP